MIDDEFSIEHKMLKVGKGKTAEEAFKKYMQRQGFWVLRPTLCSKFLKLFTTQDPENHDPIEIETFKQYRQEFFLLSKSAINRWVEWYKQSCPKLDNTYLESMKYFDDKLLRIFSKDTKGLPDFLLMNRNTKEIIFVEIKAIGDSLRKEQVSFLRHINNTGYKAIIITPLFKSTRAERNNKTDALVDQLVVFMKNHQKQLAFLGFSTFANGILASKEWEHIPRRSLKKALQHIKEKHLIRKGKNNKYLARDVIREAIFDVIAKHKYNLGSHKICIICGVKSSNIFSHMGSKHKLAYRNFFSDYYSEIDKLSKKNTTIYDVYGSPEKFLIHKYDEVCAKYKEPKDKKVNDLLPRINSGVSRAA